MTEEKNQCDWKTKIAGYFTRQDLLIIVALAVIAFLTSSFGLSHVLPGGSAPGLVHAFLKLPGPGAGIFIASAFTCLWLVLGILITKKPGTVILMALLILVFSLVVSLAMSGIGGHAGHATMGNRGHAASGNSSTNNGAAVGQPAGGEMSAAGASEGAPSGGEQPIRFDYLALVVAIIIECAGLLALEKKPWKYLFPALLTIMGIITLALWLTGNAKMGESGAAATVFPLGYVVSGILAIAIGILLWSYPSAKYIIGAGCAEVFYIVFCWAFNGKSGFFSWAPVAPAIPALITFAFVCGAVMAAIAYGFYLLWTSYVQHGSAST
jgi:hypothetical protein